MFLLELIEEAAELLSLELVRDRTRDKTGEPARTHTAANRLREIARHTDRKLRRWLAHTEFLPW